MRLSANLIDPKMELHLAALLGALSASFVDTTLERDQAVSRFIFNCLDWLMVSVFNLNAMLGTGTLVLLLIGACSVFYFRPLNIRGAFAGGFAAIAVLSIFAP